MCVNMLHSPSSYEKSEKCSTIINKKSIIHWIYIRHSGSKAGVTSNPNELLLGIIYRAAFGNSKTTSAIYRDSKYKCNDTTIYE